MRGTIATVGIVGTQRARRRLVLCVAALALLLAHQAFAAGDHRDGADGISMVAGALSAALLASDADRVGAATDLPDVVASLSGPDAPAALREACPAHQGTLPVPAPGLDAAVLVARHPGATVDRRHAAAHPPRAADPRRRRALLQVFRN